VVLVVEDEHALRDELVELVGLLGAHCLGAEGLEQALAHVRANPIDVVLCDFNLGAESGLDLLRHLHGLGGAEARPRLILMTGHTELTDAAYAAIDHFADALMLKPISIGALRAVLQGDAGSAAPSIAASAYA
jgi:CheY-like chemotaxis protein